MKVRCVTAMVAVAVAWTVTVPVTAQAAPWKRLRYEFRLDGPKSASLEFVVTGQSDTPAGFLAMVTLHRTPAGRVEEVWFPRVVDAPSVPAGLRTWGRTVPTQDLCTAPLDCQRKPGGTTYSTHYVVSSRGEDPLHMTVYVVGEGRGVSIRVLHRSAGWRQMPTRSGGFSRRTTDTTDTDGIDANHGRYEVTRGASLPGPAGGSLLIVNPPCPDVGAGRAVLQGAAEPVVVDCPAPEGAAAGADGATTWTLTGLLTGQTTSRTRLVEIDR